MNGDECINMIWKLLAAPVIGAIIGYCTNWLAVKMLFRPREEKYIFGLKVPFTPGVIPKGKKRLAAAVSKVVNEQLLTKEAVEKRLLAPEMIHMIKSSVNERIALMRNDGEKTVRETLAGMVSVSDEMPAAAPHAASAITTGQADPAPVPDVPATAASDTTAAAAAPQETAAAASLSENLKKLSDITVYEDTPERRVNELAASAKSFITERVFEKVSSAGLGRIAADTVNEKLGQALAGSFLGHMMGGSVTQMMGPAVAQTVDGYIAEHGREIIGKMVDEEVDSVLDMKASSVMEAIDKSGTDFGAKAADIYESAVKSKSGEMLERLNIGGIMQETIEDMDNEQLEDLVMSTMKTELGAVVNFGAVIGLALGIINMIIYLI